MTPAPLLELPDYARPQHAAPSYFVGVGGKRIRYAVFRNLEGSPRGTVILLTGRNECIEKYYETIEGLQARGFFVATMDWRGQGLSDRLANDPSPGHVENFDLYVSDLNQLFAEVVLPDCRAPYFVLAHSTGSLVALAASPHLQNRISRMMLIAPLLGVDNLPLSLTNMRRVTRTLKGLGFGRRYASGGAWKPIAFDDNVVTTDPDRFDRNTRLYQSFPRLALGGPTIGWMYAAARTSMRVSDPDFIAAIRTPILFIAASDDTVVSTRAIERYAARMRAGACITIQGARHEVLQERDEYLEQFWAAFDAFIPGSAGASAQ